MWPYLIYCLVAMRSVIDFSFKDTCDVSLESGQQQFAILGVSIIKLDIWKKKRSVPIMPKNSAHVCVLHMRPAHISCDSVV